MICARDFPDSYLVFMYTHWKVLNGIIICKARSFESHMLPSSISHHPKLTPYNNTHIRHRTIHAHRVNDLNNNAMTNLIIHFILISYGIVLTMFRNLKFVLTCSLPPHPTRLVNNTVCIRMR